MMPYWIYLWLITNCAALVICKSYYSVIAPGVIKSNHNYTVAVSLHDADEPATLSIRIEGPFYNSAQNVYLLPHQTKAIVFQVPKLVEGYHKLIAEGFGGVKFRNESKISADSWAGPNIYVQTDKAIYKPDDVVQFRGVLLDVHTRPLKIQEPISVEILDAKGNRVKQFKDISLVNGIYKGKFQLSKYPAMGQWQIKFIISGKYDTTRRKTFTVQKYVLPKFSTYIESTEGFNGSTGVIKALVYGKYTFNKYVEGNITAQIKDPYYINKILLEQKMPINKTLNLEFRFDNLNDIKDPYGIKLKVGITEKHTGLTETSTRYFVKRDQPYFITLVTDSIEYRSYKPYRLKLNVKHWNGTAIMDNKNPVFMKHGSKEYEAFLNYKGEATFEFEHDRDANHIFRYKDASYTLPNIYANEELANSNTTTYCRLRLLSIRPRLGTKLEIEVSSIDTIPYLNYVVVGHANILKVDRISIPPNRTSYVIEITPSIEMVPMSFLYVYYIKNGNLRYEEMRFTFPNEFENKISIIAPQKVRPGSNVTIEMKAQPNSYVGLMAVDIAVYWLDSSYDLDGKQILNDLRNDLTYSPITAYYYPGILSGLLTLTNAHYPFVPIGPEGKVKGNIPDYLDFRQKFPETWIFDNYKITNETTRLTLPIPDTITTWRLTAFTVHDVTGFGIVDGPTDIIVIQPFFITFNLPYSVKRGEIIKVPVMVHNYHNQSVNCEITLLNEDQEFNFVESSLATDHLDDERASVEHQQQQPQQRSKRVKISPNNIETVEFLINPNKVGDISLRVTAVNGISSDAVLQKLKVEPEGIVKRDNRAVYARIPSKGQFLSSLTADVPNDIVADSEYLTLSVGGDTLVPTMTNLNDLVLLPTGCGEQNMVNFAPNILILQYLKAAGSYYKERSLVKKAKRFIEIGYQQQLSFRHSNGGFSVFGQRKNEVASTWLTAYVIRFFLKVSNYQAIEPHIIDSGLELLAKQQFEGGNFPFTGYIFYPAQQNRFGFTAFVLMTFLENEKYATKYQSTIQKALTFLNTNLDKIDDIYALSIVAVALKMAKHENAAKVIDKLKLQRHVKGDRIWWSQNDRNGEKDVEITAYVLMALLDIDNDPNEDLNILKWLIDQRNGKGGFKSTHDTVVGLQALVKYSNKYGQESAMDMKIQYSALDKNKQVLANNALILDRNNLLILQTNELPPLTRSLDINVTGSGYSLMQLTYQYHILTADQFTHFLITTKPIMPNVDEMLLEICFSYQQSDAIVTGDPTTNMLIMETNLPSGFVTNDEFRIELLENEIIQRVESKNSETTLVLYFKKLSVNSKNCLNIMASKMHEVQQRKPAAISIYDYYNISRHQTVFYNV